MSEKKITFYLKFDWMYVLWKVRKNLGRKWEEKGDKFICNPPPLKLKFVNVGIRKLLIGVLSVISF